MKRRKWPKRFQRCGRGLGRKPEAWGGLKEGFRVIGRDLGRKLLRRWGLGLGAPAHREPRGLVVTFELVAGNSWRACEVAVCGEVDSVRRSIQ